MPLLRTESGVDVESRPVVADREADPVRYNVAVNANLPRLAVDDRIRNQFAADAEKRMGGSVRELGASDVQENREPCAADHGGDGFSDGLLERGLVKRVVSEVPKTVPEFRSAGVEHLRGIPEQVGRLGAVLRQGGPRGRDMIGYGGEILDRVVVKLGGQTRPFVGPQLGFGL